MSCCVKSSVLRRLAEQKGQKSMLIKGCGQLLACGFALIKAKCSCSQKTLLIYLSNSEHWLWVRPVGLWCWGHLLRNHNIFSRGMRCAWACVCVCVQGVLVASPCPGLFSHDFVRNMWHEAVHLQVMVLSHWYCALHSPWASPWLTWFIPNLAENSFIKNKKNLQSFTSFYFFPNCCKNSPMRVVYNNFYFLPNYADEFFSDSEYNSINAPMATNISSEIVCSQKEHCCVSSKQPFVKALPSWWETAHTAPNCWWAYF